MGQGTPLVLREWQKELIRKTFDPVDERGRRQIRRALWSVARKNGKTALAAALVLVFLVGPEAIPNGEVYSAATDRHQAALIYKMASQMVQLDEELNQMCKCLDAVKRIVVYSTGSFYQSLSADARRQHGFNPTFVIYDELAQAKSRDLYDVLQTSFGAQEEGLLLCISTQSPDSESIMSELVDDAILQMQGLLYDPHFFGHVYAVPEDARDTTFGLCWPVPGGDLNGDRPVEPDIYNEENWYLANPALGDFRSLTDFRALADKAKRSPAAEAAFKNLFLNMRADGVESLFTSKDWRACAGDVPDAELIGVPCYAGLDLATRTDLAALVLAFEMPDGRVPLRCYFWTPADTLAERQQIDKAPYDVWVKAGLLTAVPGRVVPLSRIAADTKSIIEPLNLIHLSYDRYRIHEFKLELAKNGLTEDRITMLDHGQGFKDMSPAIESLEELVLNGRLLHGGNPLLTWCMSNVKVSRDPAGNRKFDKRRKNRRIDGAVAAAMAVAAIKKVELQPETGPSVYERRGVLAF